MWYEVQKPPEEIINVPETYVNLEDDVSGWVVNTEPRASETPDVNLPSPYRADLDNMRNVLIS